MPQIETLEQAKKLGLITDRQPDGAVLIKLGETQLSARMSIKATMNIEAERGRNPVEMLTSNWQIADMFSVINNSIRNPNNANPPSPDRLAEMLDGVATEFGQPAVFMMATAIISAASEGNAKAP